MNLPKRKFSKITSKDLKFLKSLEVSEHTTIYRSPKHNLELQGDINNQFNNDTQYILVIDGYIFADKIQMRQVEMKYNKLLKQVKYCENILPEVSMRWKIKRNLHFMLGNLHHTKLRICERVLDEVKNQAILPFASDLNSFASLEEKEANIKMMEYIVKLVKTLEVK